MIDIKYLDRDSKRYNPIEDNKHVNQNNPFRSEVLLDTLQELMETLRTEKMVFERMPDPVSDRHDYILNDGVLVSSGSNIEKSITNIREKTKVLEHYKFWVLVRLYYQDTNNTEDAAKYVDYDTLLKTPCSSMFSYPLREKDLMFGLKSLVNEQHVKSEPTRELTRDEFFSNNPYVSSKPVIRRRSPKIHVLSPSSKPAINSNMSFALTVDGNLHVLYMLNKVLKFDNYDDAREKLDTPTIRTFITLVFKKLESGDINELRNFCINHFITNFDVFVKLREFFE